MFKQIKRISLFSLLFLFVAGGAYLVYIPDRHVKRYKNASHAGAPPSLAQQEQQQTRFICSKDLYKAEGDVRHHTQIKAPLSTLRLQPDEKTLSLVEYLTDMECQLEESDDQMRMIEAKTGLYHFNQQQLIADDVTLKVFQGDRTQKLENLVLQGHAKQATFDFSKDIPSLHATNFNANVKSLE